MESALRAAALRYLSLADQEPDPVRRLGLLDCAAGAISAARDHAIIEASGVLRLREQAAKQYRSEAAQQLPLPAAGPTHGDPAREADPSP